MLSLFQNILSLLGESADASVDPIYQAVETIGPYAIGVVGALGLIYSIILGVKMAKAEGSQEMEAAKKQLINAIIGVVAIVVLLSILFAIREPLIEWANS